MTTSTPYRLERHRGRLIVALLPELNEVPWAEIERLGGDLVQQLHGLSTPALLVDLCALNYMGSAQVALVVRLFKTVKEQNGRMVVANRDHMVHEVLELAGLDKLWTIAPSAEEGLELLGGNSDDAAPAAGHWSGFLGAACVLVSLVGMAALLTNATWMAPNRAMMLEFGAAAVAFVFGLWCVLKGSGSPRTLGAGVLVGSVALMLASVYLIGMHTAQAGGLDTMARDASPSSRATIARRPSVPKAAANTEQAEVSVPMPPQEPEAEPTDAAQPAVP